MSDKFVKLVATFFYIGCSPVGPGTAASLAATIICLFLRDFIVLYILFFFIITVLGFKVSNRMEELEGQKDPSCVVIDEVAGIFVAFFTLPITWPVVVSTFFLFRAFDMFKIYPVNKFEELEGSAGVMLDDLIAGLYTNIVMQVAVRWAGIV